MANVNVDKLTITSIDEITCFNNANELEFIMDEIQDGTINNTQEKTDITGKLGRKIGSLKKNKGVTVTATNGWIVGGALSAQTGSNIEQGAYRVRVSETVTVKSNAATLENTAVGTAGAEIGTMYYKNPNGTLGDKLTQSADAPEAKQFQYTPGGNTLKFHDGEIHDGTELVAFFDIEVEAAKISNDSETYSKTLKMYIDVTLTDSCDNLYHGQFVIPRADFSGEFELTMGGDPTVHAIEAESLVGGCTGSTKLWDLIVYV